MDSEDSKSPLRQYDYYKNVCAQALITGETDPFYGYLKKYNPKGKTQKRFCVIHKGIFFYFKDPESLRPSGFFRLDGYQAHIEKGAPHCHTFKVEHRHVVGARSYSFSGASEKDQSKWIDYINKHVIECYPVSLYSEVGNNSDFYDYVSLEFVSTLCRERKQAEEQKQYTTQNSNVDTAPAVPARTLRMDREYEKGCLERWSESDHQEFNNNGNLPNATSIENRNASAELCNVENVMTCDYVRMSRGSSGGDMEDTAKDAVEDPYLAVISGYDDEDDSEESDSEEDEFLTTVEAIRNAHINTKKSIELLHVSQKLPNNVVKKHYSLPPSIDQMQCLAPSIDSDDAYTEMVNLNKEISLDSHCTKNRALSDAPTPMLRPRVVPKDRAQTLPPTLETHESVSTFTRAAVPPPIPERRPVKAPSLTSLHENDIMPKSCMYANIQREQCLHFLSPFEVGTYLIRTERDDGKDALAILAQKNPPKVKHFIVFESSDEQKYLHKEEPKFKLLHELIQYYYYNNLPQTGVRLIKALTTATT